MCEGVGEGFDVSATVGGPERGAGPDVVFADRGDGGVEGVTVLPGVVTASEEAVVVVVGWLSLSMWRRT